MNARALDAVANAMHALEHDLVETHPDDAARLEIEDGDLLRVASRRGKLQVRARLTDTCPPGVVSLTFHFAEAPTNVLTHAALDELAGDREPEAGAVHQGKDADESENIVHQRNIEINTPIRGYRKDNKYSQDLGGYEVEPDHPVRQ